MIQMTNEVDSDDQTMGQACIVRNIPQSVEKEGYTTTTLFPRPLCSYHHLRQHNYRKTMTEASSAAVRWLFVDCHR